MFLFYRQRTYINNAISTRNYFYSTNPRNLLIKIIKTKTFKENLETLYNSLERRERELNKVSNQSYYCLKDDLENKEEVQRFIEFFVKQICLIIINNF